VTALDDRPTAEGSTVTFGELRAWLAEHGVDMDRCVQVGIGQNLHGSVMLRVEEYAVNEDGERFTIRTVGDAFDKRSDVGVAVETRWVPLKHLPGVGG
jgi:hypothetical protein